MILHPDLAESWDAPDPLTYIFHLRKNVHFHDNRPVTSPDVQSTFAFMMNPANKSPKAGAVFALVFSTKRIPPRLQPRALSQSQSR
jgi:ABC-type transport system substrate-binding protein